jgi:hypothetical protein
VAETDSQSDSYPRQQTAIQDNKNRQVLSSMVEREIVRIGVGCGFEQAVSRILCLQVLTDLRVAIIYLGRQLPGASSDQPGG